MEVYKINMWFKRFGTFQIKNRIFFLIGLALITAFCCFGLKKIKLSGSESDWFSDWEETKINEEKFKSIFGSDDSFAVLVQAENVFDPEVLNAIKNISLELEQNVPYAKDVVSLTNLSLPVGNDEGFEVINPFADEIPENPEELHKKETFIMSRESLINNIVSDDKKETWILLSLEAYEEDLDEAKMKITPPAKEIIKKYNNSSKYSLKEIGMSYTEYEEDEVMNSECAKRIGFGGLMMILCLIVFVRSFRGVIVPFISTIFGICTALGITGYLKIEGSSMLFVLPVLLAMALSVGYSIHYINSFRLHFRKSGLRKESAINAVEESGWPILFTVITTMAGMLSFLSSGINQIKWVGGFTAACVFTVYTYVIILIPIFLSFGKNLPAEKLRTKEEGATECDLFFQKIGKKVLDKKIYTIVFSAVLIAIMLPGFGKIEVNMDYVSMMGKKIPYVARIIEIMNAKMGSQYDYKVMLEFNEEDALKNPDVMKRIDLLSEKLGSLSMTKVTGDKARVTSVTSIAKEMNRTMNFDDSEYYKIPDDQELLTQLLFLYEVSGGDDLYNWVNEDFSTTYVHVALKGYNAEGMVYDVAKAKEFSRELFPEAKISIIGQAVNFAEMNGKLVRAELKSFTGSFIIILILMSLAFSSVKTGLIGMIPNIAPVILIGGIMGHCDLYLDMFTMTIMPMILGIAVDDTIHFINHIKYFYEKTENYQKSILSSYREIGKTMGMTTLILCAMFIIISFSPVTCLAKIGFLSVLGLSGALVADYTLTPVLIYLTKPFGKEKNK